MTDFIIGGTRPALPDGVVYWPDTLPKPQFNGYSFTERDGRIITDVAQGAPRVRRGYRHMPTDYQCVFKLTREQLAIYRRFYRIDLDYGVLAVAMPILDERGIAYVYLRILRWSSIEPLDSQKRFSLQLTFVEVGRPDANIG
ncbi:MAG: hypothetical protein KTR20_12865 [Cellvibrionaceae bacterium]|nr:hypothetical protein [Cellvibrionaceae bacterium]